jgi:hypothetical protein
MISKFFAKTGIVILVTIAIRPAVAAENDSPGTLLAELPNTVREQLTHQAAVLQKSAMSFTEIRVKENKVVRRETYSVFSDGARFYEQIDTLSTVDGALLGTVDAMFDGETRFYYGNPSNTKKLQNTPSALMIHLVSDKTNPEYTKLQARFPYLNAAGFYAPEYLFDIEGFSGFESLVLHNLEHGTNVTIRESADGIQITAAVPDRVLRAQQLSEPQWVAEYLNHQGERPPNRIVSLLLDPKHGYGIAKREDKTSNGSLIGTIETKDWEYHADADIWLPKRCISSYYTEPYKLDQFSDSPVMVITDELTSVQFAAQDFPVDLRKYPAYQNRGTIICDRSIPEAQTNFDHQVDYTVNADGKQLRIAALAVSEGWTLRNRAAGALIFIIILGVPPLALLFRKRKTER